MAEGGGKKISFPAMAVVMVAHLLYAQLLPVFAPAPAAEQICQKTCADADYRLDCQDFKDCACRGLLGNQHRKHFIGGG